jgi:O-antigen/teichoic acid export membrane protein
MIKKLFSSQLRINMASGMLTTVINTVVIVVAYPIYLHFLGYEKYGVWLVLATVLTFTQLGNLGMGPAVMKLVAEEYGRGDIEGIQHYVTTALALLCLSGTVALIVILALKTPIVAAFKLSDENAKMVLWLLPYIGVLSIYVFVIQVFEATLSGLGRMDSANYIQSVGQVVAVTVAGILLYSGRGIESLLIGRALSDVFIHIASLVCIWRIAPIRFLQISSFDVYRCKRLLHFGSAVFGSSLISMLLSPFNKLMLSRYAGVSTVPIYEIVYNGGMQIRSLIETGLKALMPEISRIGANITVQTKNRILQLNRRAMKLIFLFGIPIYGILSIFSPSLLRVWLGDRFVDILPLAFRIMLIATFLSLICVPAYYTLLGLGRVRQCFFAHAIQAGTNVSVVLLVIIIKLPLSVIHVFWAALTAMGMTSIYILFQNHRMLNSIAEQYPQNDVNPLVPIGFISIKAESFENINHSQSAAVAKATH